MHTRAYDRTFPARYLMISADDRHQLQRCGYHGLFGEKRF